MKRFHLGMLASAAMLLVSTSTAMAQCGSGGDCCVAGTGPGCLNVECCTQICAADAFCCETQWDEICANAAVASCSVCGGGGGGGGPCGSGGDCCVAGTGPGCADVECCTQICAADAFCCETQWDQICADAAVVNCSVCGGGGGGGCTIPPGTSFEQESCGDDINGGCNGGIYEPAAIGAQIAGTFWANAGTRDTDWFEITVSQATEISLEIFSNMPCFAAVVNTSCSSIIGDPTTGACPGTTAVCVVPGSYYVVALPSVFSGYACGASVGNEYTLKIGGVACDASPPANDTCANAAVASVGANPFDNTFANTDWGIPSCGFNSLPFTNDVFFTFTPPTTGFWSLETCSGSAPFDTGIEVYDGCPDAGGTQIACNDDGAGCAAFASSLVFEGTAGTPYIILVGGWNGATGATELVIAPNDGSCPAGQIEDCNGACCPANWVGDGYCDDGTYTFGGVPICLNCEEFAFDGGDCAVQGDCSGGGGGGGGGGCGSGGDCCVPGTGPGCLDVECCTLVCAADAFCCDTQWDQICANAAIASCSVCGGGGDPPANDNCANAQSVGLGNHPFDTNGATTDGNNPTDPSCGSFAAGFYNDVWFTFAAPSAGNFTASTCNNATFDTRIDILTACGGTLIACNDDGDGCANFTSSVVFAATAGQVVTIRLGAYAAGGFGTGTLAITSEGGGGGGGTPGLTCESAIAIQTGATPFNRAGATEDLDYAGICDMGPFGTDTNFNVIWHKFAPTQSGTYTVSTCNAANHDTRLSVQTGCAASTVVACNDDFTGCAGFTSELTFDAVCGQQYYILVGGYSASTPLGTGTMTVSTANGTNCSAPCPGDFNGDGIRDGADLGLLLAAFGISAAGDMNGDGLTDGADLGALLAVFGQVCP